MNTRPAVIIDATKEEPVEVNIHWEAWRQRLENAKKEIAKDNAEVYSKFNNMNTKAVIVCCLSGDKEKAPSANLEALIKKINFPYTIYFAPDSEDEWNEWKKNNAAFYKKEKGNIITKMDFRKSNAFKESKIRYDAFCQNQENDFRRKQALEANLMADQTEFFRRKPNLIQNANNIASTREHIKDDAIDCLAWLYIDEKNKRNTFEVTALFYSHKLTQTQQNALKSAHLMNYNRTESIVIPMKYEIKKPKQKLLVGQAQREQLPEVLTPIPKQPVQNDGQLIEQTQQARSQSPQSTHEILLNFVLDSYNRKKINPEGFVELGVAVIENQQSERTQQPGLRERSSSSSGRRSPSSSDEDRRAKYSARIMRNIDTEDQFRKSTPPATPAKLLGDVRKNGGFLNNKRCRDEAPKTPRLDHSLSSSDSFKVR